MENKKLDFKINYKKMPVFVDYNTDNIAFPLVLSMPHSGSYFPPEFLEQVNSSVEIMRHNEDIFVDELLQPAIDGGVPSIKMLISRSVIDLNRDRLELDPTMFYNYPKDKDILY
ncbi:MAG: N-formylglutamate amidohydrolase, partial [Alphaproteobacteria bacterium]|nr:N-formylglutamate amidohydrolase [Alphaproteobacteria bacterium]